MASSFSGKAGRKAAMAAEGLISGTKQEITSRSNAAEQQGRADVAAGTQAINTNYGKAIADLKQYYPQVQGNYDKALGSFDRVGAEADAGTAMLANALGLHGAEGNAAATGAFQAGPGYEYERNQAEDAVMRRANAGGMLTSGNMMTELSDRTQGLANQQYGSWLDRLAPYMTAAQNVAGARAGIYGQKAGAAQQMGAGLGAIHTGMGDKLLQAGEYNAGQGLAYNTATNQNLMDLGSQTVAARTSGMMAGQQAAANRMSAMMGGAQLAGQIGMGIAGLPVAGGGSVGGNFLSQIFK